MKCEVSKVIARSDGEYPVSEVVSIPICDYQSSHYTACRATARVNAGGIICRYRLTWLRLLCQLHGLVAAVKHRTIIIDIDDLHCQLSWSCGSPALEKPLVTSLETVDHLLHCSIASFQAFSLLQTCTLQGRGRRPGQVSHVIRPATMSCQVCNTQFICPVYCIPDVMRSWHGSHAKLVQVFSLRFLPAFNYTCNVHRGGRRPGNEVTLT